MSAGLLEAPVPWAAAYVLAGLGVLVLAPRHRRVDAALIGVAVLAAILLAVRPGWDRPAAPGPVGLVTAGASGPLPAGTPAERFRLQETMSPAAVPAVPDAAWLRRHRPGASSIALLGHGLPAWDWSADGPPVRWLQRPALSPGIREVRWQRGLFLGQVLRIQGRLADVAGEERIVRLEGPGGTESSQRIAPDDDPAFTLESVPRSAGRFLYRIEVDGEAQEIDVTVEPSRERSVLWLESSPQFETRAFRDWLLSRSGSMAVRTRISRERFRREFHRRPELDLSRVTPELIAGFDLLVLDDDTWRGLSAAEHQAVEAGIRDGGVGAWLLQRGEAIPAASPWSGFTTRPVGDLDRMTASVAWTGGGSGRLELPARELDLPPGAAPLARDAAGRVLAGSRRQGAGAAGVSLLDGTFRWVLEGEPAAHHRLWALLVEAVSRPQNGPRWLTPAGPLLVDEPMELELRLPAESRDAVPAAWVAVGEGVPVGLALRQDPVEAGRWTASFWPPTAGWYRLESRGGATVRFRVQDRDRWSTWQQHRRQSATARQVVLAGAAPAGSRTALARQRVPSSPLAAVLLGCLLLLWIRERW